MRYTPDHTKKNQRGPESQNFKPDGAPSRCALHLQEVTSSQELVSKSANSISSGLEVDLSSRKRPAGPAVGQEADLNSDFWPSRPPPRIPLGPTDPPGCPCESPPAWAGDLGPGLVHGASKAPQRKKKPSSGRVLWRYRLRTHCTARHLAGTGHFQSTQHAVSDARGRFPRAAFPHGSIRK